MMNVGRLKGLQNNIFGKGKEEPRQAVLHKNHKGGMSGKKI